MGVTSKLEELLLRVEDEDLRDELRQEIDRHGEPLLEVVVLVACGPNEVRVPCRLFRTWEEGVEFCERFLEPPNEETIEAMDGEVEGPELYIVPTNEMGYLVSPTALTREVFTRYYSGCGSVWGFYLTLVPFNSRFVGFDLD